MDKSNNLPGLASLLSASADSFQSAASAGVFYYCMSEQIEPDDNDLVVPARQSIFIYWNAAGALTIKQPDLDQDHFVVIQPEDILRVADRLRFHAANPPEPIE